MNSLFALVISTLLSYIPVLVVSYLVVTRTITWHRLRHFPGPLSGKFSSLFMVKAVVSGQMHLEYAEVSKKYGSLARIGPNDLITDDPEVIKRMSAARNAYNRSSWYQALRIDPYHDFLVSLLDTDIHDTRRAKLAVAFSGKENASLEDDIDSCVELWIDLIRNKYLSKGEDIRPMDLARKSQYFTLDVITKVGFGRDLGYLRGDEDVYGYIESLDAIMLYIALFTTMPLTDKIVNQGWVKQLIGPGPNDSFGMGRLMRVAKEVVAERFGDNKVIKHDMLGSFVRSGIPQRQIETELLMQIIAGSDSSATAIRATMLYLMSQPRVLFKVRAEIDDADRAGKLSSPIKEAESKALPYLQAVIKEGLRIHPPLPSLFSKEVPATGDVINGQYVPPGTRIGHDTWGALRNSMFGEDVEVFRPDRWLEVDPERLLRMEQCVDLVFGYGRWGCLGKNVAMMELNKIFAELLRHFEFELMYPDRKWKSTNYQFFQQKDLWVRVSEREKAN